MPRRFAPRNDSPKPLSFRGGPTGRRGNPSFLRWTGVRAAEVVGPYGCNERSAQQRHAVPRAWPPPTKFRPEIWGVGQVVGPYGKPNQPPKPAGAQRSVRASGREGWAGIGAKAIPKGGPPPRPPRQRLAKRKARKEQLVKFDFCPMTSECSTAQKVRKSDGSPARAHADVTSTEQNRLAPRPAARQGASRARNCAAKSVFSFDGSTAVFFLGRQKENGGGKLQVITRHHAPFGVAGRRHAGSSCPTGGCGEPPRLPWVAAHSGVSAPAGARDGWESR